MYAPPGVDSESSGEEDYVPPPPTSEARPKYQFSFRALFESQSKAEAKQEKKTVKSLTPVEAAEELSAPSSNTPHKRRVRIHLAGEDHPDEPHPIDLLESPLADKQDQEEDMQTGTLTPNRRPDEVAGEVLGLLRHLLAETNTARQVSPPGSARLEPVNEDDGDPAPHLNALGLSGHADRSEKMKKPSKFSKLAQITGFSSTRPSQSTSPPVAPNQYQSAYNMGHTDDTHRGDQRHGLNQTYYQAPYVENPRPAQGYPTHPFNPPASAAPPQTSYSHAPQQHPSHQTKPAYPPHQHMHQQTSPAPPYPTSAPPWTTAFSQGQPFSPPGTVPYGLAQHGAYNGHTPIYHHQTPPGSPHCPHCMPPLYMPPQPAICYPLSGQWSPTFSTYQSYPHHQCPCSGSPIHVPDPATCPHSPHHHHHHHHHQGTHSGGHGMPPHPHSPFQPHSSPPSPPWQDLDGQRQPRSASNPTDPPDCARRAALDPSRPAGAEAVKARNGEPSQPPGPQKEGLQSPKIVVRDQSGFKEVDAYPQAKEKASKHETKETKGKPPGYTTDQTARPASSRAPAAEGSREKPTKVDLSDPNLNDGKRREIEAMKRAREKEKTRDKAAEGSLSPREVGEAVEKAAEARHTEDVEEQLSRMRKQRKKIEMGIQEGKIDETKGMKELDSLARAMAALKPGRQHRANMEEKPRGEHSTADELADVEKRIKRVNAKVADGSLAAEDAERELKKLTRAREQMRSADDPIDKDSTRPAAHLNGRPAPADPTGDARSEEFVEKIKRIKRKVANGSMPEEAGMKEMGELKHELERLERVTNKATVEDEPDDNADRQTRSREMDKTDKDEGARAAGDAGQLKQLMRQIDKIKQKVLEGSLDKERGKKELAKLDRLRFELQQTEDTSSLSGPPPMSSKQKGDSEDRTERAEQAEQAEQIPDKLASLKRQIERMRTKIKEGAIEEEEGTSKLARLMEMYDDLKREDAPGKVIKIRSSTPDATGADDSTGRPPAQSDVNGDEDEKVRLMRKQMDRIKQKVNEGSIPKEEGMKELSKLAKMLEGTETKAVTNGNPSTADKSRERKPKIDALQQGELEEKKHQIAKQMSRIKRKIEEGSLAKEDGMKEMAKLAKMQEQLGAAATKDGKNQETEARDMQQGSVKSPSDETAKIERQMKRIKQKIKEGAVPEDEGRKELSKLSKMLAVVHEAIAGRAHSQDAEDESAQATERPTETSTDISNGRERIEGKMKRIQRNIVEGVIPKDEGMKELSKLAKMLPAAEVETASGSDHGIERSAPTVESAQSNSTADERGKIEARMKGIQAKVKEGAIPKEEGMNELMKLSKMLSDTNDDTAAQDALDTDRQEAAEPARERKAAIPQDDSEERQKIEARMKRIQEKIKEGALPKEEGKKDLMKLSKMLAASNDDTVTKEGRNMEREEAAGPAGHREAERGRDKGEERQKIEFRMKKLQQKIVEGAVPQEEGKKELAKLSKMMADMKFDSSGAKQRAEREEKRTKTPPGRQAKNTSVDNASQREKIEAKMMKIKHMVMEGAIPKDEGMKEISKLSKRLAELDAERAVQTESRNGPSRDKPEKLDSIAAARGISASDIQDKLDRNKESLTKIKSRVTDGKITPEEAEKMLRKLTQERDELKKAMSTSERNPQTKGREATDQHGDTGNEGKGKGRMADEHLDQELDPEILKEVLGETSSIPDKPSKTTGSPDKRDERQVKDQFARVETVRTDESTFEAPARTDRDMKRESTDSVVVPGRYPKPPPQAADFPDTSPYKLPSTGANGKATSATSGLGSPLEKEEPTWSNCLVSLATCIDLANEVLAELMVSSKGKRMSQDNSLLMEILPRLLTSLLMQRDLVSSMKGIFGDEHSQPMEEFMNHLGLIRRYLADQHRSRLQQTTGANVRTLRGLEQDMSNAFEIGSITAIIDHLINLSDYLTPQILGAVKDLFTQWHKDGFTISNVIRAIMTIQRELKVVAQAKAIRENDRRAEEPARGIMTILDQLLAVLHDGTKQEREGQPEKTSAQPPIPHSSFPVPQSPDITSSMTRQPELARTPIRERKNCRIIRDKLHDLKDKLDPHLDQSPLDTYTAIPHRGPSSRQPVLTGDQPSPLGNKLKAALTPTRHHAEAQHQVHEPHLHLPEATQAFLEHEGQDRSDTVNRPSSRQPHLTMHQEEDLHHIPESTIVRPPGPCLGTEGSSHRIRRPSVWSSDSHYSDDASEGTLESDEEARELLAHADSGPAPVVHEEGSPVDDKPEPDADQVRRAREVMLAPERHYDPPMVTVVHKIE